MNDDNKDDNKQENSPLVAPGSGDSTTSDTRIPADSLIAYLTEHPEERVWQAIRNWSGQDFILFGNLSRRRGGEDFVNLGGLRVYVHNTFDFGGKES